MSEIKYGLISKVDADVLEKTLDLICNGHDGVINITEIGIYSGETGKGMREYIHSKRRKSNLTGIDSGKDEQPLVCHEYYDKIIFGKSNEFYHELQDNSQHLIFVDGCHCFAHVISDFFCYAPKVKAGGYFAFHDTGKHIKEFKDFQHGDKENPDAYISARRALMAMGLVDTKYTALEADGTFLEQWDLIFDEADPNDEAGGICVFKKLY